MLKDMQSIHAPGKTTKNSDVLAGDGKGNTGLSGLGEANASKYSVIFRLAEKMKVGVKPELKHICPGCGTEVSAPLEFPDGIKSLFVIPDISGELL